MADGDNVTAALDGSDVKLPSLSPRASLLPKDARHGGTEDMLKRGGAKSCAQEGK
jgi:hypothetical protein